MCRSWLLAVLFEPCGKFVARARVVSYGVLNVEKARASALAFRLFKIPRPSVALSSLVAFQNFAALFAVAGQCSSYSLSPVLRLSTMSIAEFYIENGMDPADPHHWDDYLGDLSYKYDDGSYGASSSQRRAAKAFVLNQSELDSLAQTCGWEILDASSSEAPMASYFRKEDGTRLNFWLTTGTVGSYLDHPRQGKTQLFRRKIDMSQASELFTIPVSTRELVITPSEQQQKIRPKKREQISNIRLTVVSPVPAAAPAARSPNPVPTSPRISDAKVLPPDARAVSIEGVS